MFIRRSPTRSNASGGSYYSFRLVHNVRTPAGVRQQTLLNLGADFSLPQSQWSDLVAIVEDLRHNREPLFAPDPALEQLAEQIHIRLSQRGLDDAGQDLETVHLDSLDNRHVRSVGAERIALHALDQLGFPATLNKLGLSQRHQRLASALVIARMLRPGSERAACAWLNNCSAALELLSLDSSKPLELNNLYRTADRLWTHRAALEKALSRRALSLFPRVDQVVLVDLTNLHYCGRPGGDRQFGRSKQKRNDCPLVTLGMTLDSTGFPLRSAVLPGNVSEPGTLADALEQLALPQAERPTVIMDAGLSTDANIAWLRDNGYHWITVERGREAPPADSVAVECETRKQALAKVWELQADSTQQELRLCVWSESRNARDESILQRQRDRFEAELRKLHEGLTKPHCTKRYDRVLERIGRLKERYRKVAYQYQITVSKAPLDPDSSAVPKTDPSAAAKPTRKRRKRRKPRAVLASAVQWEPNERYAERSDTAGTYLLRTSHTDWDLQRVVQTYWRLTDIEATFRSLKSELGLRPIHHTRADRIRSHLFIAVLAYHAVHLIRQRLAVAGRHDSWLTLREKLALWVRQSTLLQAQDGRWIETRQDSRPDPEAAEIARTLGVPPQLHRRRRVSAA